MARDTQHMEFDGHLIHQTDNAFLFHVDVADEDIWFPISQCELDHTETSILVPLWLAKAKNLL